MPRFNNGQTPQIAHETTPSPPLSQPHRRPGAGAPAEKPLMAMVRALARSEARRLFRQADEQGHVSLPLTFVLAVLALVAIIVLRGVFR